MQQPPINIVKDLIKATSQVPVTCGHNLVSNCSNIHWLINIFFIVRKLISINWFEENIGKSIRTDSIKYLIFEEVATFYLASVLSPSLHTLFYIALVHPLQE
eukprot:15276650-Ditylum_brightwellii.AAC.1